MRQSVRQQLAGVVLNAHSNLQRADYEELKAILHNCVCLGPETQNRECHPDFRGYLLGRIAYVSMLHPARGAKLRAKFALVSWSV